MAEGPSKTEKALVYEKGEIAGLRSDAAPIPNECDCSVNDVSDIIPQSKYHCFPSVSAHFIAWGGF